MNKRHYSPRTKAAMLACGFLSASCFTYAQDADEEVFELSPFSIDASEDEGYYASQTMAGGRLNQSLKNTGASIQVITKDFMDDLGATGIDELLQYTTSSEVAGILGNFTGSGGGEDGQASTGGARRDPDGATRIRGLSAPDRTRNFFVTEIPFDSYNTERIDINRGANSFLFGLGTPAGLINNGLAQARFKDSNEISARIGSGGKDPSYRASFKLNRVIAEDKLAVVVAGLMDRTQYRQRPTFKNDDRIYTAFTYRPFKNTNTEISGHFERGEVLGNAPDVLLPQHNLDTFLDSDQVGRLAINTYDNIRYFNHPEGPRNKNQVNRAVKLKWDIENAYDWGWDGDSKNTVPYIRNNPSNNSLTNFAWGAGALGFVFDGTNGAEPAFPYTAQFRQAEYLKGNPFWDPKKKNRGNPQMIMHGNLSDIGGYDAETVADFASQTPHYNPDAGWQDQGFTDLETFDFSRTNLGWDNDYFTRDFFNYNLALKQSFWEGKGGFEFAYDYQDLYKGSYTAFNGGNSRVIFDINRKLNLPTDEYLESRDKNDAGVIDNPNFGRPFVLTKSGKRTEDLQDEVFRFTGFAKYDFADHMNSDFMSRMLGNHTLTALADKSTSDEIWINWTTNSFGAEGPNGYDPALHIGAPNARQSANNVRNTPLMAYVGPQQLNAFSDPNFTIQDFQLTAAKYNLQRPNGEETDRVVWHLGDEVTNDTFDNRWAGAENHPVDGNEDWKMVRTKTLEVPTKNYRMQQTKISSMAINSQSMMLDNHLVLNMGYREDTIDNSLNTEAALIGLDEVADLRAGDTWLLEDGQQSSVKSTVFGYGGVVYWPKELVGLPDWIDDITFHYNTSENFVPATDRVDQYRNRVESPKGDSKDYGMSLYMFQNKVIARLNWYDAFLENERSPVSGLFNQTNSALFQWFSQLNQDLIRTDLNADGIVDDAYLVDTYEYDPDTGLIPAEFDDDGELITPEFTKDAFVSEFYPFLPEALAARDDIENALTPELKEAYNYRMLDDGSVRTQWAGQITDTNDISAKGFEGEIILNPTKSWRVAFNAAQQQTVLTNIAPRLTDLFDNTWIPHLQQFGTLDWNTPLEPKDGNNVAQQRASRMVDYFVAKAQEGRPTGEQREWRFNMVTNYQFREGMLNGFSVGGAVRWQDSFNAGYPMMIGSTGFAQPDVYSAFKVDPETSVDLTFGYRKKIMDNVDWRLQINVRNVHNWDNDQLLTNVYQPDGSIARVRFGPPRQILLTNTFRF